MQALKNAIYRIFNQKRPKSYFLVMGAGRGGTSLLAALLDYHTRISMGFEAFAADYLLGHALPAEQKHSLIARLNGFATHCKTTAELCDVRWGNKITTEQIADLANCTDANWPTYVQQFIEHVVAGHPVVFILRDGRSCVDAKMRRTDQTYVEAANRWKTSIALWQYFVAAGVPMHTLKYEDLVANPEAVLTRVCQFLRVKYQPAMLQGTRNPNMPAMYQNSSIRPLKAQSFPESWTNDMAAELRLAGYLE